MIDIEAMQKKQAAMLLDAIERNTIEASLPVPNGLVTTFNSLPASFPWVSYRVDSLVDAMLLMDAFTEKLPYAFAKRSNAVIRPMSELREYEEHIVSTYDGAPMLNLEVIDARIYLAELQCFARVHGRMLKITVRMEKVPARITVHKRRSRVHDPVEATKQYPTLHEDHRVLWASGGDTSGSVTYLWGTDSSYGSAMAELIEAQGTACSN